jgi:uncharacterized protein
LQQEGELHLPEERKIRYRRAMEKPLYDKLFTIAKDHSHPDDPSHDFGHIQRVLKNVEYLAEKEHADLDVLVPAALFHDVINYPKNDPRAAKASEESADWTAELLRSIPEYPQEKLDAVHDAIAKCSFRKGIVPDLLESKILQDADMLESTGAISVYRCFAYAGNMHLPLHDPEDPFCENREPDGNQYAVDLFFSRLFKIKDRMHTATGKRLAEQRHAFLHTFLTNCAWK